MLLWESFSYVETHCAGHLSIIPHKLPRKLSRLLATRSQWQTAYLIIRCQKRLKCSPVVRASFFSAHLPVPLVPWLTELALISVMAGSEEAAALKRRGLIRALATSRRRWHFHAAAPLLLIGCRPIRFPCCRWQLLIRCCRLLRDWAAWWDDNSPGVSGRSRLNLGHELCFPDILFNAEGVRYGNHF